MTQAESDRPDPEHDAAALAWEIHSAIADWTKGVDTKASFVSAIETAVLLGVIALAGDDRQLSDLEGCWQLAIFWLGVLGLVFSLLMVLTVVAPHLRSRKALAESRQNFIFFGHAQHWDPDELKVALQEVEPLDMLSRQIVTMSKIAWRKHRYLQFSIVGAVGSVGLVALAAWMNFLTQ